MLAVVVAVGCCVTSKILSAAGHFSVTVALAPTGLIWSVAASALSNPLCLAFAPHFASRFFFFRSCRDLQSLRDDDLPPFMASFARKAAADMLKGSSSSMRSLLPSSSSEKVPPVLDLGELRVVSALWRLPRASRGGRGGNPLSI